MNAENNGRDECESVGGPLIRVVLDDFVLAPEFQYLKNAVVGDAESCPIDPTLDNSGPENQQTSP